MDLILPKVEKKYKINLIIKYSKNQLKEFELQDKEDFQLNSIVTLNYKY